MKQNYHISVNQFAEFSEATKKGKAKILQQQVIPNKVLIPWYQSAKGSIKRYFTDVTDYRPLRDGIKKVSEKKPENKRQLSDKTISLEALKKMVELHIERHFKGIKYEIVKPISKAISFQQVDIGISPELAFKAEINGQTSYGGIKIHISKNKPFSLNQCQQVAILLMRYIEINVAKPGENVIPAFCLCIDIFGDRVVSAIKNDDKINKEIKELCEEIKTNWPE